MGFQTSVNITPAPACAGDFASGNPRASALSVPGGLVAGSGGCNVGLFAWQTAPNQTTGAGGVVTNAGTGAPDGFVHRQQNALITTFLAETGVNIPQGMPVDLMVAGDFWCQATVAGATKGQKAFASLTTGAMQAAAAGATVAGYVETPFWIASTCAVNELCKISTWGA